MKGVAPNGSMLASSILLMMEEPAMEAASPALRPGHKHTHVMHRLNNVISLLGVCVWLPGQMMRVLRTGRFSLLVVKGVMVKEL